MQKTAASKPSPVVWSVQQAQTDLYSDRIHEARFPSQLPEASRDYAGLQRRPAPRHVYTGR